MGELRTDRLILRPWRAEDRAPFASLNADSHVMRYFPAPLSREESDDLIDRIERKRRRDGYGMSAVTLHDGTFLGMAGITQPSFQAHFTPCTEVGWRFARHAWGNGYATEAAHAALAHGFRDHDLGEIVSFTAASNTPSERVMQRLGMRPAGRFLHPKLPEGSALQEHLLYRLTRTDWEATR